MFESGRYNGWTNHETWLINLWLNNDQWCYFTLVMALNKPTIPARAEWLDEQVRWMLSEQNPDACLWSDLLTLSIGRVNWLEIVENQD